MRGAYVYGHRPEADAGLKVSSKLPLHYLFKGVSLKLYKTDRLPTLPTADMTAAAGTTLEEVYGKLYKEKLSGLLLTDQEKTFLMDTLEEKWAANSPTGDVWAPKSEASGAVYSWVREALKPIEIEHMKSMNRVYAIALRMSTFFDDKRAGLSAEEKIKLISFEDIVAECTDEKLTSLDWALLDMYVGEKWKAGADEYWSNAIQSAVAAAHRVSRS